MLIFSTSMSFQVVDAGYFDDVFCGTDLPSDVMSNSNRLILIFTSDTSGNKLGFNITYKSVERTGLSDRHFRKGSLCVCVCVCVCFRFLRVCPKC